MENTAGSPRIDGILLVAAKALQRGDSSHRMLSDALEADGGEVVVKEGGGGHDDEEVGVALREAFHRRRRTTAASLFMQPPPPCEWPPHQGCEQLPTGVGELPSRLPPSNHLHHVSDRCTEAYEKPPTGFAAVLHTVLRDRQGLEVGFVLQWRP